MIVGEFSIRDVHPVNIGNATKTVRFKVEFEGIPPRKNWTDSCRH